VPALDEAAADIDGGTLNAVDPETIKPDKGSDHVNYGINGPHLVKMYFVRRGRVNGRLGLGKQNENPARPVADSRGHCAGVEKFQYVVEAALALLSIANLDEKVRAGKVSPEGFFGADFVSSKPKLGEAVAKLVKRQARVEQRADYHVAACAGKAIEIENSQTSSLREKTSRKIREVHLRLAMRLAK
jgi:hypothetical protein